MERIPDYLETLSLLMQDCAERGDLVCQLIGYRFTPGMDEFQYL